MNLEERRPGTYVSAESVAAAFEAATFKYQARHPRLHVETVAVRINKESTLEQRTDGPFAEFFRWLER